MLYVSILNEPLDLDLYEQNVRWFTEMESYLTIGIIYRSSLLLKLYPAIDQAVWVCIGWRLLTNSSRMRPLSLPPSSWLTSLLSDLAPTPPYTILALVLRSRQRFVVQYDPTQ